MISTGYYGKPASVGRCYSSVHLVANGKPICGYKPSKNFTFQMCAGFVVPEYLTCKKCKEKSKVFIGVLNERI